MNFQPDCPMERGGLAVLALGDKPSQSAPAGRSQIPPFVTYGDIFPRPGEVGPLRGSFIRADREMHKSSPFGGAGIA